MRFAGRFAKPGERYHGLVTIGKNKRAIWTGKGRLDAGKLAKPLHWKRPRRIFVNSMSDLFYEEFTNEEIAAVFGVMAACPQHTFQILTKRATRMREWFRWVNPLGPALLDRVKQGAMPPRPRKLIEDAALSALNGFIEGIPAWRDGLWPLRNVHLGVSTENQPAFDERWPDLFGCPAAVWWFSAEPLLSGIDMTHMLADFACKRGRLWLVAGCESGPSARPAEPDWYRSFRDQCQEAGVPFFLKQAQEVRKGCVAPFSSPPEIIKAVSPTDRTRFTDIITAGPGSKRKAGGIIGLPYLDGVQHAAFPITKEMTP
jgi:protein gp37